MTDQIFEATLDGHHHRVVAGRKMRHPVAWFVDDELVSETKSMDEKVRLSHDDWGHLVVRFAWNDTARRATWFSPGEDAAALTGLGGDDLTPEPGSPAAVFEQRLRDHPRRYALIQTLGGVAKVVVPILVTILLAQLAFSIDWPDVPWPDLPNIPRPDLPDIPWPDLPSIPWPDWAVPGWVKVIAEKAKYVLPVVIAYMVARGEIKRRHDQDEKRQSTSQRPDEDDAGK